MSGMFKALGNLTGGRNNTKENLSPKPRSGSHTQLPTNISRLVGLVRDGKIQTAMEELAKATTVVDSITTLCLMAEPNNRSTLLHAAAEVGSEEVAKAVIAYTGPANSLSPLVNAQDKQGMHEMRVAGSANCSEGFTPFHVAASAHQYAICDLLLEKVLHFY